MNTQLTVPPNCSFFLFVVFQCSVYFASREFHPSSCDSTFVFGNFPDLSTKQDGEKVINNLSKFSLNHEMNPSFDSCFASCHLWNLRSAHIVFLHLAGCRPFATRLGINERIILKLILNKCLSTHPSGEF